MHFRGILAYGRHEVWNMEKITLKCGLNIYWAYIKELEADKTER